jgi:hypothetical protein
MAALSRGAKKLLEEIDTHVTTAWAEFILKLVLSAAFHCSSIGQRFGERER